MKLKSKGSSARQQEIVTQYLLELDKHLLQLKNGEAETTFEIKDLAALLFIDAKHLSNTIKEVTGQSPCDIYELRLMDVAKDLIANTNYSIATIARTLTFDPSNFTKFFKSYANITPNAYRASVQKN
jgi:AraC family transcriptional regulator, regulatory protein of adaptative response / methylphosphotriester-DNA alkyltransferase methyltransferase